MAGKAIRENVELAFDVFCKHAGNAEATRRELDKKHGLKLARTTFEQWMKDGNFKARRVEMDAHRQADKEATKTAWVRSVKGLLKVMSNYETYMESKEFLNAKGKPDNQAVFAYVGVISALRQLLRKLDYIKEDESVPDANVKVKAEEILRDIYGIG